MRVAIIGFGRFGRLAARELSKDCDLKVHSSHPEIVREAGYDHVTLEEACRQEVVIPCVPISKFKGTIQRMAPLLSEGSVVADVCSVKQYPVEVMQEHLPAHVGILGSHPMFGPDSASQSVEGQKIILCRIRLDDERYHKIKTLLGDLGLTIIETTPEQHDKDMADTLILTHFIGRSLMGFEAGPKEIDTEGYKRLLRILGTVRNDSWQLFEDMCRYNPEGKRTISRFLDSAKKIQDKVRE